MITLVGRGKAARSGRHFEAPKPEIVDFAIHLAAESIFSALCSQYPAQRYFRIPNYELLSTNAMHILHCSFADAIKVAKADPSAKLQGSWLWETPQR